VDCFIGKAIKRQLRCTSNVQKVLLNERLETNCKRDVLENTQMEEDGVLRRGGGEWL
jgi:hypothetical protein